MESWDLFQVAMVASIEVLLIGVIFRTIITSRKKKKKRAPVHSTVQMRCQRALRKDPEAVTFSPPRPVGHESASFLAIGTKPEIEELQRGGFEEAWADDADWAELVTPLCPARAALLADSVTLMKLASAAADHRPRKQTPGKARKYDVFAQKTRLYSEIKLD